MEQELDALLDEFAQNLANSPASGHVRQASAELALVSARLADELRTAHPEEAAEKTVLLDELGARAGRLQEMLPDAILAGEQEHWAARLESIRSALRQSGRELESLRLSALSSRQRALSEHSLVSRLSSTRRRLGEARAALHVRDSVSGHPLHQQLERIRSALSSTRTHVQARHQEYLQARFDEQKKMAYAEMRDFFCRQISGRVYVDGTVIQLRSDLSGRLAEWTLDVPHAAALVELFGEPGERLVERLRDPSSAFSARFEARSSNGRLHLLIEGGERTVRRGGVSYAPQRFFCSL